MMQAADDPVHPDRRLSSLASAPPQRQATAAALVALGLIAWILLAYWGTTRSMAAIWERSETFAHGYLVVPIVAYLVWRDRAELAAIVPQPWLPALAALVLLGGVWLIATRLAVNSVAQFAMVAMIPTAVCAALGTRIARRLAFPLAFLFFAVPFGEFLMPTLMDWTADVTIAAVRASGIPVYRDGNYFTIPSGRWSVVEACSGLRYLIASMVVGCLFAYLSFRSPLRRALFIAASIAVPLVANWVRAYLIVMLGHWSGNQLAVGADHLVYGWLFFGVVMAILFLIGARWREDAAPVAASAGPTGAPAVMVHTLPPPVWRALLAVAAVTAAPPLYAALESPTVEGRSPPALADIAGHAGWNPVPSAVPDWRPDIAGATAWRTQTFARDGATVAVTVAYFDGSASNQAITSTNQLVRTVNKEWQQVAAGSAQTPGGGPVRTAIVTGHGARLAVWQWYWVAGHVTAGDFAAKFEQARAMLQGRQAPVAWVVLATPAGDDIGKATERLGRFAEDMRPAIDAALAQTARAS